MADLPGDDADELCAVEIHPDAAERSLPGSDRDPTRAGGVRHWRKGMMASR